jgi:C4-dicarboxylate-specific signal transduction histidine kinase
MLSGAVPFAWPAGAVYPSRDGGWMAVVKRFGRRNVQAIMAAALALAIFAADTLSPLQGAVAVLYTIVVLMASASQSRIILSAGLVSALLAVIAFLDQHHGEAFGGPHMRLAVSLVAIAVTTLLCLQNRLAAEERNRAQARLAQALAELAHASRVTTLGQMAASIAHEVNQPLSAIITYAKSGRRWLGQDTPALHEVEDCLDHIVTNGVRAADVIARVRALAKKDTPQPQPVDLAELAAEAVELLGPQLQSAAIQVHRAADDGVPQVTGDKVQIQQVITNLLMNAVQAMGQPGASGSDIAIMIARRGRMVMLSVADRGGGLGSVEPARLFEPFFTTKSDGMGMGLSICRSIIEAHGGRMTAADRPEGGAVFSFTLPVIDETVSAR